MSGVTFSKVLLAVLCGTALLISYCRAEPEELWDVDVFTTGELATLPSTTTTTTTTTTSPATAGPPGKQTTKAQKPTTDPKAQKFTKIKKAEAGTSGRPNDAAKPSATPSANNPVGRLVASLIPPTAGPSIERNTESPTTTGLPTDTTTVRLTKAVIHSATISTTAPADNTAAEAAPSKLDAAVPLSKNKAANNVPDSGLDESGNRVVVLQTATKPNSASSTYNLFPLGFFLVAFLLEHLE